MQYTSSVFAAALIFPLVYVASEIPVDNPNSNKINAPKFSDIMKEYLIPSYTEGFSRFVKQLIPSRPEFRKWLLRCDQITQPSLRPVGVVNGVPVRAGYECGFLVKLTAEIRPYGPDAGFVPVSNPPEPARFFGSLRSMTEGLSWGKPGGSEASVPVMPFSNQAPSARFSSSYPSSPAAPVVPNESALRQFDKFMRGINHETTSLPYVDGSDAIFQPQSTGFSPVSAGYPPQRDSQTVNIPNPAQSSLTESPGDALGRSNAEPMPLQWSAGPYGSNGRRLRVQ